MSDGAELRPLSPTERPLRQAAVFVHSGPVGAHVGLVFRFTDEGEFRLVHQAWHHDSRDDSIVTWAKHAEAPLWWVPPGLDDDELDDLRTHAALVAKRLQDGSIPYAFAVKNALIRDDGAVALGESLGLTCATFVTAVFEFAHIPLLDTGSWDRGRSKERQMEDEAVQRKLVNYLKSKDPLHASRVAKELGCTRVRAEEVAAASAFTVCPVDFTDAEREGRGVLAKISVAA